MNVSRALLAISVPVLILSACSGKFNESSTTSQIGGPGAFLKPWIMVKSSSPMVAETLEMFLITDRCFRNSNVGVRIYTSNHDLANIEQFEDLTGGSAKLLRGNAKGFELASNAVKAIIESADQCPTGVEDTEQLALQASMAIQTSVRDFLFEGLGEVYLLSTGGLDSIVFKYKNDDSGIDEITLLGNFQTIYRQAR